MANIFNYHIESKNMEFKLEFNHCVGIVNNLLLFTRGQEHEKDDFNKEFIRLTTLKYGSQAKIKMDNCPFHPVRYFPAIQNNTFI